MISALMAATAAFCAVLLVVPASDASLSRLRRRGSRNGSRVPAPSRRRLLPVGAALAVLLLWFGGGTAVVVAGTVAVAVAVARKVTSLWRLRRMRQRRQRTAISLCDGLAAELRAGLPGMAAVLRTCEGVPDLAPVTAAARLGSDVPAALRSCASVPGARGLRAVAASWEVAASSGAALAAVLERTAASLRSEEDARAEVTAALGPPRATAKMLAGLPLAGIAMGESMGAHPASFLLGTSWGLACLAAGIVLALTGIWWVEALATAAER